MDRIRMALNTARMAARIASNERSMVYLGQARKALEMAKLELSKSRKETNVIDMSQYLTKTKKVA